MQPVQLGGRVQKKEKKKEARKKCFSLFKLIDTQKIGNESAKKNSGNQSKKLRLTSIMSMTAV